MTRAQRVLQLHGIYLIVNESERVLDIVRASLAAGVGIVQYRAKGGIEPATLRTLRELTLAHGALLILNDDWRTARAFGCDGAHLGPGDPGFSDAAAVRAEVPEMLLGFSCASEEEMRAAYRGGADYAGVGSVYSTHSKADAGDPIGIEGLRHIAAAAPLPVAAVGGITLETLREVRQSGVAMAATISAVADAGDPAAAAAALVRLWG